MNNLESFIFQVHDCVRVDQCKKITLQGEGIRNTPLQELLNYLGNNFIDHANIFSCILMEGKIECGTAAVV